MRSWWGGALPEREPDPVVYFEVLGRDAQRLSDFYSAMFGWDPEPVEPGGSFRRVDAGEGGIQGGIGGFEGYAGHVTFYVRTSDLAAAVARCRELGGDVLMEPRQVAEGIETALVKDPEGHVIGLIRGL
jgi:predicted enzyme related to lactoylglutathione lyase